MFNSIAFFYPGEIEMSKIALIAVIVLSTIECLIDGENITFLPGEEPQKVPKDAADEAVKRGLAKAPEKLAKPRSAKSKKTAPGDGQNDDGPEGSDDDDGIDDDKDKEDA